MKPLAGAFFSVFPFLWAGCGESASAEAGRENPKVSNNTSFPSERSSLTGVVRDEHGRPVDGAFVTLTEPASRRQLAQVRTEQDGQFVVRDLPPRPVEVHVHTGRHRNPPPQIVDPAHKTRLTLNVRSGETIRGRVLSPEGAPLAGATVGCSGKGSSFEQTDPSGRFIIGGLEEEPVNVFALAKGYPAKYVYAIRPGTEGLEIRLIEGGGVRGRLPEAVEAEVSLWRFVPELGKRIRTAGARIPAHRPTFEFDPIAPGEYSLEVAANGHPPFSRKVRISSGRTTDLGTLKLLGGNR